MSPPPPACNLERIRAHAPACLRERPQWVCWQYVLRGEKWTKVPVDPKTGGTADSTDPSTWGSFEEAAARFAGTRGLAGVGYVFAEDDPYCGVDLDDCIDPDAPPDSDGPHDPAGPGVLPLKPWAREFVERLDTYTEVSPSGTGVKAFAAGKKPGKRCRKGYHDGEVEVYDRDRFFTVTGNRLEEVSAEVEARQDALEFIYQRVFGETAPPPAAPTPPHPTPFSGPSGQDLPPDDEVLAFDPDESAAVADGDDAGRLLSPSPQPDAALTDGQILNKAMNGRKGGSKFSALWAGRWNDYFNSASEADASVLFTLAFYTKDPARLDRLFRTSGLMRPKWDEARGAQTYGRATIDNALAHVKAQWKPKRRRASGLAAGGPAGSSGWEPGHLSQQVNAERLVQVLAGDARYHVDKGSWLWFDGRRFVDDYAGRVDRAAKCVARHTWQFVKGGLETVDSKTVFKHAVDSEKAAGVSAMMKLARTEPGLPARAQDFDPDPYLFNCRNGTIDLRTGALRPHDRNDLMTKLAPVAYDPARPRPLFDAFLRRVMADNPVMVDYLKRVLGRCLSGDVSEQELYFFLGEGANGKSVLIDTVLGVLGDYAGTAPESLLTVQSHNEHPTEIADLCGKRLVVASETEEDAKLKVQLVKRLTGDGRIKGRFMRQDFFEFDRTHKLIVVSNNKPVIRETKHAIWRRFRLVPFSVIIPEAERDAQLAQKLKAEWPGVLAWLVEGYRDWREGGMRTPKEVLLATQSYQDEQNPLGEYLADRCVTGTPAVRVGRNDLFTDYASWCHQTGDRFPLSRNALFDHVRSIQGVSEGQWRVAGVNAPVRGFLGVGLACTAVGVADWEG